MTAIRVPAPSIVSLGQLVWSPILLPLGAPGAQSSSMRVTQPSPTAAALGRFGDVPVNLYAGVADISVPLFAVTGRTLALPIVARYHAAGLRVEEVGGWLGMGWSLDAGGTITRTVRGLADESASGYWSTGFRFHQAGNWPAPPPSIVSDIEAELLDGEPDQFFFSFAGRSGQFVMGQPMPSVARTSAPSPTRSCGSCR